jgi:DNA-directed RNA polymerase subunit RPC12/RpoP
MSKTTGTPEHTAKCLRCGRTLRVSTGYGPTCLRKVRIAAIEAGLRGLSPAQQAKALDAMGSGDLEPAGPAAWLIPSSRNDGTRYRVTTAYCPCQSRILLCWHVGTVRAIEAVAQVGRTSYAKAA